jgi:hypothetical protein
MSNQNIINPKDCIYKCGTRIYWDTSSNSYLEVFTKQKHICPNRSSSNNKKAAGAPAATINKLNYYNNKFSKPKPKMSNPLELLSGPIIDIQKKYEILSDIVITEYNGKVHGSQRDRDPRTGELDLLVYYEVPEGKREEVKSIYNNRIRTMKRGREEEVLI